MSLAGKGSGHKVSESFIMDFAKTFDPQPFHTDEESANESIFRGLIASSLHTLSACTRVVVEAQRDVVILSVGMDEVRMFNPVRPGDILDVKTWWSDLKQSQSKPERGFASIKCKVLIRKDNLFLNMVTDIYWHVKIIEKLLE